MLGLMTASRTALSARIDGQLGKAKDDREDPTRRRAEVDLNNRIHGRNRNVNERCLECADVITPLPGNKFREG